MWEIARDGLRCGLEGSDMFGRDGFTFDGFLGWQLESWDWGADQGMDSQDAAGHQPPHPILRSGRPMLQKGPCLADWLDWLDNDLGPPLILLGLSLQPGKK